MNFSGRIVADQLTNSYYPSDKDYLYALADALKHEYQAIASAGFVLQIDAPDAAMGRHVEFRDYTLDGFRQAIGQRVEILNHALDGIPDRRDAPGGLDAKRHRRGAADLPPARPDELLPIADASGPNFDQDLVVRKGARIRDVDRPDNTPELADTGGAHQRRAV